MAQVVDISTLSKEEKIRWAVNEYIRLFPVEFKAFQNSVRAKRAVKQDKFAQVKESDFVERFLYEIPETLFYGIKKVLTTDEWAWFQSNDQYANKQDGPLWFHKNFPMFAISE